MSKPIIAQCPACKTRYSVTPGQLRVADGQVRCGQCLTVFDAIPKVPKETPAPVKKTEPIISQPSLMKQVRALKVEPPELDSYTDKPASQGWAITACFFALSLMAGQYLWFERALLSKDPFLMPVYDLACQQIDCTLPSTAGLDALNTTHLIVREVTDRPDVLELLTGVHNSSMLPIQLPNLRLQFSDINGRVIAARDITATTYRPQTKVIQPNEKLDIRLLIKRPGTGHLGYEIDWIARSSL
ncbi:MAG: DUF3426 domain-containing protein [Oceanospirillales bacterium]|nr:MAG: DUF3426 domain-containing protein [Oceanospirillales bacterium]